MLRFVLEGLVYCKEDIEKYLNKASEKFKEEEVGLDESD